MEKRHHAPSRPCSALAPRILALAPFLLVAACDSGTETDAPDDTAATATPEASETATPTPVETATETPADTPEVTLPLQQGHYVISGTDCANPANAAWRIWNGEGLSGSSTRACRAEVTDRDGSTYSVTQSCEDTYSGERSTRDFTLTTTVLGFTMDGQPFALCPAETRPDWMPAG